MPSRFICPCCHCPIDPSRLETAVSEDAEYRICPECDAPLVFSRHRTAVNTEGAPGSIAAAISLEQAGHGARG